MKILVDSREQCGYGFPDHEVEIVGLQTGDYSVKGAEDLISIERKSLNDLIGSLSSGRSRFERELFRSKSLEMFVLLIESSVDDILQGRYRSKMNPVSVIQSILTYMVRYGVQVVFAGNRNQGQYLVESLLAKYAREIQKRYEAIG